MECEPRLWDDSVRSEGGGLAVEGPAWVGTSMHSRMTAEDTRVARSTCAHCS